MGLIEEGRKILGHALENLPHFVILLGLVTIGFSFVTYEKGFHFPTKTPNWYVFGVGVPLIVFGFIVHFLHQGKQIKRLKDKTTLTFGSTTLTVKIGGIQTERNLTSDSAFILPANTTFFDDCVTDSKSALGSFFKEHHEDKIATFINRLKEILLAKNITSVDGINYAPSTVVMLPEEFSIKSKVILVACSVRDPVKGFHTDPAIISNSIFNIFRETADKKITTFYFPIMGSGHGGMEITGAMNLLVLCIKIHSRHFTHVRNVIIFVRESDRKTINASFLNSL